MLPNELVTAIVVAFDSAHALPDCLTALAGEGVRMIVVDNASSDASANIAIALGAKLIRNARNEGYGRANNIGMAAVTTPYALIVNPDLVVGKGSVAALLEAASRWQDAALFAPRITEPNGRLFFQRRSLLSPAHLNQARTLVVPEGDCCAPFLSGACLLVRRDVFLTLGGFDEEVFLFYEDDDLCRRLRDSGHALVHVDLADVQHGRGRSTAATPERAFTARWHLAWSRAYMQAKYDLPSDAFKECTLNAMKAAGYGLLLNFGKARRHAGSAAGSMAFMRRERALIRERLAASTLDARRRA
ncbi:MAG: glycosyltransferase family 2 protein [Bosea sp. (in: a-proteobacteria)]